MTGESEGRLFASLDADERLPRELHEERIGWRGFSGDPNWRHFLSFLWPPAFLYVLTESWWRFHNGAVTVSAVVLLFVAFWWFIHRRSD
ncbi:MAG: hypothetical protein M3Z98_02295 [Candidatus Dormibacteraeota bacterium]|nr:hypothetical protein [Candidatus Dormibacteraeota bacterium]